ncbi:MAG: DUF2442 domain-containing protein [Gammaproteobacteria bacterium]
MTYDNSAGIYRTDSDRNGTHGWTVFVQRRRRVFTKHFADGMHGGQKKAYRAASKHREYLIKEHLELTRAEYASILRRNNTSGVPGVCKYQSGHWVAFWPTVPGKARRVKFSVAKYGEKKAFELAAAARRRALEQLQEPFSRSQAKRRQDCESSTATMPSGPDLRIKRASVQRYRLRAELYDERVITVPLLWFPKLYKAKPASRQEWVLNETGDGIVWGRLGLTIASTELLAIAKN